MSLVWALDLGGTKIELLVSDSNNLTSPIVRKRTPTGASNGYDSILTSTKDLIESVTKELQQRPEVLGVSCCGTTVPATGLMKNCNATALNGRPFPSDLEKAIKCPTLFANDANCFAYAEAKLGGGRGGATVFGVILGTGVGGGIVINGKMHAGAHGLGGEWGHNVLVENGGACYCGKSGCLEQMISGPALERYYQSLSGQSLQLKDIAERAAARSDQHAVTTIDRFLAFLGRALGELINILDPDIVVLGGGASNINTLYSELPKFVAPWIFGEPVSTPIRRAELGDSAGVFGAAILALEHQTASSK